MGILMKMPRDGNDDAAHHSRDGAVTRYKAVRRPMNGVAYDGRAGSAVRRGHEEVSLDMETRARGCVGVEILISSVRMGFS